MDSILQWALKAKSRTDAKPRQVKDALGPFLSAIESRRVNRTNSNIAVTGEPGLGKSTLSLVCGERLRPDVFVDHPEEAIRQFVTFKTSTFIRAIKDAPKGSVIIGDEFGQQMHHRTFMKEGNISLSNVLQGFRYQKHIAFMNVPSLTLIDADAQRLLTWMASVSQRGKATIYRVTHPTFNGVEFFHTFIDEFFFAKPGNDLWKAYEAAKFENQERVLEDSIRIAEKVETIQISPDAIMKAILEKPEKYMKMKAGKMRFHAATIEDRFGIGTTVSRRILSRLNSELIDKEQSDQ